MKNNIKQIFEDECEKKGYIGMNENLFLSVLNNDVILSKQNKYLWIRCFQSLLENGYCLIKNRSGYFIISDQYKNRCDSQIRLFDDIINTIF